MAATKTIPAKKKSTVAKTVDQSDKITLDRLIEVSNEHLKNRIDGLGPSTNVHKLPGCLRDSIREQINDGKVETDLKGKELNDYLVKQIPDLA